MKDIEIYSELPLMLWEIAIWKKWLLKIAIVFVTNIMSQINSGYVNLECLDSGE